MGIQSIKPEQLEIVAGIVKSDIFAVLPTGYGKNACFQCLPRLHDKLTPTTGYSIVLVITPYSHNERSGMLFDTHCCIKKAVKLLFLFSITIFL